MEAGAVKTSDVTERVYRNDPYRTEIKSEIKQVQMRSDLEVLVLDRTPCFPTGGGQPCDRGTVTLLSSRDAGEEERTFSIMDVYDHSLEGDVFHVTDAPAGTFHPGDQVLVRLDWDRRFANMQRHLGEHLLSGALYRLFGWNNKGFHMGEEYMTIDVDVPHGPGIEEKLSAGEAEVNRVIWRDLPVSVDYFENKEAASVMPVRKPVTAEGRISVVTAGDKSDPADCCACCGTHPDSTGQVGLVKIYKAESNKGMTRIFFDAGSMAMKRIAGDMSLLREITDRFSAGSDDIMKKLDTRDEKEKELHRRVTALRDVVMENEKKRILEDMAAGGRGLAPEGGPLYTEEFHALEADDLVKLGFALYKEGGKSGVEGLPPLTALVDLEGKTVLLFSGGTPACGDLVKTMAKKFGGRGGGRPDNARAVFQDKKSIGLFLDAVAGAI